MDCSLIETLRWEPEVGFMRLERHLARLARSAAALRLPGADGARAALATAVEATHPPLPCRASPPQGGRSDGEVARSPSMSQFEQKARPLPISPLEGEMPGRAEGGSPGPLRVRLELFPDGRIEVQTAPFTPLAPGTTWRVKIARTPLNSADPLLRHKTSHRAAYVAARAEYNAAEADEVLLANERGELCEGTITSLFLDDGSGILKTPPLGSGLLAGVLREELLETGRARERVLRPQDLEGRPFFLGNSLRGLVPAVLR